MTTNDVQESEIPEPRGPLFRIRELRAAYGEEGLGEQDLAALTGMPVMLVRAFEACQVLPDQVAALLRLAFALQVQLEEMIDARTLQELREPIAFLRSALEGGTDDAEGGFRCRDDDR